MQERQKREKVGSNGGCRVRQEDRQWRQEQERSKAFTGRSPAELYLDR